MARKKKFETDFVRLWGTWVGGFLALIIFFILYIQDYVLFIENTWGNSLPISSGTFLFFFLVIPYAIFNLGMGIGGLIHASIRKYK